MGASGGRPRVRAISALCTEDVIGDNRQKLRLVKLSLGRIEALILPFFEKAVKDKDVAAGTLCCKLEERLALLLGLDAPTTQRVDVYQIERQQQPSQHEQIRRAIFALARGDPDYPAEGRRSVDALGLSFPV